MSEWLYTSDVAARLRVSPSGLYRLRAEDPDFPEPVRLRPNGFPRWPAEKIEAYMHRKEAAAERKS